MKSVLIIFDQAYYERIIATLDGLNCRDFIYWGQVRRRGSKIGEPHYDSHAWPSMCSAVLTMVEDERMDPLLEVFHNTDKQTRQLGLQAFVWSIEETI